MIPEKFRIYNATSASLKEANNSVDLVVAAPPYNVGTMYGTNNDTLAFQDYGQLMRNVFGECYRVLRPTGSMLLEVADSVNMGGQYVQLAGLLQSICLMHGFSLRERHINFVKTIDGIEVPEDDRWTVDYVTTKSAHSNCHQWLLFTKEQTKFCPESGSISYIDYREMPDHPCPFPEATCNLFMSRYFTPGMTVLEPFMGTAQLGRRVLDSGGFYVGYEIDPLVYSLAQRSLLIS